MIDSVEILTTIMGFSTMTSSKKVPSNDCNNDRQPEIATRRSILNPASPTGGGGGGIITNDDDDDDDDIAMCRSESWEICRVLVAARQQ